jgi:hypothetical protein
MRRTATICAALAAFALSGAQAQAGFLFFGDSGGSKCCKPAPKCCNPAPKCSNGGLFSIFKLPKLSLPKLSLPKLPSLGGNSCCKPAPKDCSGGSAPALSPSAGGSKVEDAPAPPPYEEKAPAPAPPAAKKDPAPAPAPAAKKAAAPAKKAAEKKAAAPKA